MIDEHFLDFELRDDGISVCAGMPGRPFIEHTLTPQQARATLARLRGVISQLPSEGEPT